MAHAPIWSATRRRHRAAPSLVTTGLCTILCFAAASRATAQPPSVSDTVRFLEQSTFGPTVGLISHVQAVGFEAFLQEQFNLPLPTYPDLGQWPQNPPATCTGTCVRDNYTMYPLQVRFFQNALAAPDQLRQRVVFALNQIFVISAQDGDLRLPSRMLPYLQVLDRNAFGNVRELVAEITLNPGMGRYLDMVGNDASAPNENYARELLQLFTIGLNELNPDGTPRLDGQGHSIPTYGQDTVTAFARAFTGWVFAPPPATGIVNYVDPMVPGKPRSHDTAAKVLLDGVTIPGGLGAAEDLQRALDNIVTHANVGPFLGRNLIQHLVTSNPSPAYVGRVAAAFSTSGGDMKAVIRAILLDPEARDGSGADPNAGHLREPVLWITSLLRAFDTSGATTDFVLADSFLPTDVRMSEDLFNAASVFNFFPPGYTIPGELLKGPEFKIQSTSTAVARTNFAYEVVYKTMPTTADRPKGTWLDLSAFEPFTANPSQLVDLLDAFLLHGTMTAAMHDVITASVANIPASQPAARARNAVYLVVTSPQYLVER